MLKRRFENIITYLTHPITKATSESINAKIQWVKYTARGFRNKQNFINAIYFDCAVWTWLLEPTKNPVGRVLVAMKIEQSKFAVVGGGGKSAKSRRSCGISKRSGKVRCWTFRRSGFFHGPFTHK